MNWPLEYLWLLAQATHPLYTQLEVECLPEMGSTNQHLLQRAREGRSWPCLLVAERQTAGRGRQGRAWHSSQSGQALTFSLGLPLTPKDWMGLSLLVGLAVVESLDPQQHLGLQLKWPNDIWYQGRKLGGILVETVQLSPAPSMPDLESRPLYAVLGVGLNISPPPQEAEVHYRTPPACLQELLPTATAPAALGAVVPLLLHMLPRFCQTGFAPWRARFSARDALKEKALLLSDGRQGKSLGVNAQGCLRLQTSLGQEVVQSGEVSIATLDP